MEVKTDNIGFLNEEGFQTRPASPTHLEGFSSTTVPVERGWRFVDASDVTRADGNIKKEETSKKKNHDLRGVAISSLKHQEFTAAKVTATI